MPALTLRAANNAAVAEGVVACNVVERSVAPKVSKQKRPTLDLGQAQESLSSLDGGPYGPLVELALWTGMRRGELLALRWKDVDLDIGQARVLSTLTRLTGKGLVESDPKTEESANTVPLVGRAVAALQRQRQAQLEASSQREDWRVTEHVFHGPRGGPLDPARATEERSRAASAQRTVGCAARGNPVSDHAAKEICSPDVDARGDALHARGVLRCAREPYDLLPSEVDLLCCPIG